MQYLLTALAITILVPLGLTATLSATDLAIQKTAFGLVMHSSDLGKQTTLIISNEEMNDTMKILKSIEESGLLIKELKMKQTSKKVDFLV